MIQIEQLDVGNLQYVWSSSQSSVQWPNTTKQTYITHRATYNVPWAPTRQRVSRHWILSSASHLSMLPSFSQSVLPCVWDCMFLRYLQYLSMDWILSSAWHLSMLPSFSQSVLPCVWDCMFLRYLQNLSMDWILSSAWHLSILPSFSQSVLPCFWDYMFLRYLQHLLTDCRQTFVIGASWDKHEPIRFLGQKVTVTLSRWKHRLIEGCKYGQMHAKQIATGSGGL